MNRVKITALRRTEYADLMARYENPLEQACEVSVGQQWVSIDAARPEGLCDSAWQTLQPFVKSLAEGHGNFYDGWMRNPMSALISCNDGFRPVSFLIELEEK